MRAHACGDCSWMNALLSKGSGIFGPLSNFDVHHRFDVGMETQRFLLIYAHAQYKVQSLNPNCRQTVRIPCSQSLLVTQQVLQGTKKLHVDHWIHCCEDLDGEIVRAMRFANATCTNPQKSKCPQESDDKETNHKKNVSKHKPWQEYFDNRTACRVQVSVRCIATAQTSERFVHFCSVHKTCPPSQ
eukprot:4496017-Pyramimonas_sp.AAC.1